ncbi:hypothetical protein BDV96DRAFT_651735 [Lophiotrema nucula]|uniref:Piwi domain-containing protein n=1 Tax=Lophiotrema nucula TaxID=690887 RepID=A0A6A5YTD3_9PLEO|nr:hypothetical protein BDV96DRAFT_651735 [Lophiotrema nucula]
MSSSYSVMPMGVNSIPQSTPRFSHIQPTVTKEDFPEHKQPENGKVIVGWKSGSKTAVGRLHFQFAKSPPIHVITIRTFKIMLVDNEEVKFPILSRRVRYAAVKELQAGEHGIRKDALKLLDRSAIHIWDGNKGEDFVTDALVIPLGDYKKSLQAFRVLENKRVAISGVKYFRRSRKGRPQTSWDVICEVTGHTLLLPNFNDIRYRRAVDILIKRATSESPPRSIYGVDRETFYPVTNTIPPAVVLGMPIYLRCQPRLGLENVVHVDFDLVPMVPKQRVSDLLLSLFGATALTDKIDFDEPLIQKILIGLSVRKVDNYPSRSDSTASDYTNSHSTSNGLSEAATTSRDLHTPSRIPASPSPVASSHGPVAANSDRRIVDIQSGGGVTGLIRAEHDTAQGPKIIYLSVRQYFKRCLDYEIEYPQFPYANIGRQEPGYEVWVPLELLVVSHLQPVRGFRPLLSALKQANVASKWGPNHIRPLGDTLAGRISSHLGVNLDFVTSKAPRSICADPGPTRTMLPLQSSNKHIGIIYVASENSKLPVEGSAQQQSSNYPITSFSDDMRKGLMHIFCPGSPPTVAEVTSLKQILISSYRNMSPMRELLGSKPKMLFGVVDDHGRSDSDIKNIYAELQKLGNQELGALVICTRKSRLEAARRTYSGGDELYFPRHIMRKFSYMDGQLNFVRNKIPALLKNKTMVVGAHLHRPGPEVVKHCPSVASIVASIDFKATHYPGSSRLQPTLPSTTREEATEDNDSSEKRIGNVHSTIVDLGLMITERLEAWTAKGSEAPAHLLFYRDGLQFDFDNDAVVAKSLETVAEECQSMKDAYRQFLAKDLDSDDESAHDGTDAGARIKDLQITYVVVHKNTEISEDRFEIPDLSKSQRLTDGKVFGFAIGSDVSKAMYQFYVVRDDLGLRIDALKPLTADINSNYQLTGKINTALPVHYASKLCKRMYDYFHFCVSRDWNHVPSNIRRTRFPRVEDFKNDEEVKNLIQDYVLAGRVDQNPQAVPRSEPSKSSQTDPRSSIHQNTRESTEASGSVASPANGEAPPVPPKDRKSEEETSDYDANALPWHPDLNEKMFYL